MHHILKIKQQYLIHIIEGVKTFEIRKNDRDYQVGDTISYMPLESDDYDVYNMKCPIPEYEIIYIHSGFGVNASYVVMSIKEIVNDKV